MFTIKTSVIEKGSFREKIWNVLDKIYRPVYNVGFVSRWAAERRNLIENNEVMFTKLEVYKDTNGSRVILYKLPEVKTDNSSKNEFLYFDQAESVYFATDDRETNTKFPVIENWNHRVYLWRRINNDGYLEENNVAYFKNRGWFIVDEYIENKDKVSANVIFDKDVRKKCDALKKKIDFFNSIGCGIFNFMHTIDSIILCIRFPFLYTRNRWTDRHYNNWKLLDYIDKIKKSSVAFIKIRINEDEKIPLFDSLPEIRKRTTFKNPFMEKNEYYVDYGLPYTVCGNDGNFMIRVKENGRIADYIYYEHTEQWLNVTDYIKKKSGDIDFDKDTYKILYRTIVLDKKKKIYADFLKFLHDYVIAFLFCIPTRNELDAMDEGWRRAFGIKICKEIRKSIIKNANFSFLFKYRITQIKEKFGGLRWYDNGGPAELYEIINKYENISYHTCICCGKPAKYITSGYICPYCENCISEKGKENAIFIDENGKEHKPHYDEQNIATG